MRKLVTLLISLIIVFSLVSTVFADAKPGEICGDRAGVTDKREASSDDGEKPPVDSVVGLDGDADNG